MVEEQFAEDRLIEIMNEMEEALKNRFWLCEKTFGLADISIAPFVERVEANGLDKLVDFDKRPKVGDWWNWLRNRHSYHTVFAFQISDV